MLQNSVPKATNKHVKMKTDLLLNNIKTTSHICFY